MNITQTDPACYIINQIQTLPTYSLASLFCIEAKQREEVRVLRQLIERLKTLPATHTYRALAQASIHEIDDALMNPALDAYRLILEKIKLEIAYDHGLVFTALVRPTRLEEPKETSSSSKKSI